MSDRIKITFFFLLVMLGVALRYWFREVPNFAPVAAIALFAGFLYRHWLVAIAAPLAVLTITNSQLGGYESWAVMISVYACLLLPVFVARKFLPSASNRAAPLPALIGCSLVGSLLFFLVTNYTSWLYWYPGTPDGFLQCYTAALPFFRYTLMGDLFFCSLFFGAQALVVRLAHSPVSTRDELVLSR